MKQYSPIGPIAILEDLHRHDKLGNYLLLLAHEVLAEPERWTKFIENLRGGYPAGTPGIAGPFIIMDNSVIELGKPMDFKDIYAAAKIVSADVVMLPDVLGDFEATKALCKDVLDNYTAPIYNVPFMFVPQGSTQQEVNISMDWYLNEMMGRTTGNVYFGIPRWITQNFGSRIPTLEHLSALASDLFLSNSDVCVHLLGMSNDLIDDISATRYKGRIHVMGIDSANPCVVGQQGKILKAMMRSGETIHRGSDARGNYFQQTVVTAETLINIDHVRDMLNV